MSKKSKGVCLDSTPPYGVGVCEDAKARMKHQALMQEYQELQKVCLFSFVGFVFLLLFGRSESLFLIVCFLGLLFTL